MSDKETEKTTFTKEQEYMLIGLKTVYQNLIKQQNEIERAAMQITGDVETYGRTCDWLSDEGRTIADLCKNIDYDKERGTWQS